MVVLASVARLVAKRRNGHASVDRSQEGLGGRRFGTVKNGVPTAHAKMRKQDAPVAQIDKQVLGAATNANNAGARDGNKVFWERVAQTVPSNQNISEGFVQRPLKKALTNRFNLGELGHVYASIFSTTNNRWLSS